MEGDLIKVAHRPANTSIQVIVAKYDTKFYQTALVTW